ncbi:MAG TPA: ParB N-terminal domain-containing protein [Gemmatimonadales bacterium]|nr:ParB N-terminal domain-containing protein [Gemmatimonadales bacterium]
MPEPRKATRRKRTRPAPEPRGLTAKQVAGSQPPAAVERLAATIAEDGGSVIGSYREPLEGQWQILAGLPIGAVVATPYQRDLSEAHVRRLADAITRLGRFMDPIVAVRQGDGTYWTPNGNHRLAAMRSLGARSVVALVVPEPEVAHRILVLNCEKAHNVRERALEVIRLAEVLEKLDDRPERSYETEFEEPALLTLGCCYQRNGRFSGGAYHSVLKRVESFLGTKLSTALATRRARAEALLELDAAVLEAIQGLKARGFESPYLRAFVLARINPLRFTLKRGQKADFDETIAKMLSAARRFDASRIRPDQVARAAGPPEE